MMYVYCWLHCSVDEWSGPREVMISRETGNQSMSAEDMTKREKVEDKHVRNYARTRKNTATVRGGDPITWPYRKSGSKSRLLYRPFLYVHTRICVNTIRVQSPSCH